MRFAYADPPYLGQARRRYGTCEVNHQVLIGTLTREFPDGWALSCSSPSLRTLLPMCPPQARVLAWVKPWCSFKPGVRLAYAWEPVILHGGRPRRQDQPTVRDWVAANATRRRGLAGAKPERFCAWLLEVLNAQPGDELVDLFPGTGTLGRVWAEARTKARSPRREENPMTEAHDYGAECAEDAFALPDRISKPLPVLDATRYPGEAIPDFDDEPGSPAG